MSTLPDASIILTIFPSSNTNSSRLSKYIESMLGAATIAFRATFPLVYVRQCRQRKLNVALNSYQKALDFFKLMGKREGAKTCNKYVFCGYMSYHNALALLANTQNMLKSNDHFIRQWVHLWARCHFFMWHYFTSCSNVSICHTYLSILGGYNMFQILDT